MSKITTILLDADGVVLKDRGYFSDIYSKQYNVPVELIIPFFKTKFGDCQRGICDIKKELPPYLKSWRWQGTVDDLLDYWFSDATEIEPIAIDMLKRLKTSGVKCYLATDQEKYRGRYIKNELGLKKYLDGFFFSCDLGFTKSEEKFFEIILNKLDVKPTEVLFADDDKKNIEIAKKLGISTVHIKSTEDFKDIRP